MLQIAMMLTKLPLIGTAMGFISAKKRLFIEYLMVGAVVVLGGMVATLWLQKAHTEKALLDVTGKVNVLQLANVMQTQRIQRLQELREKDSAVLQSLANELGMVTKRDATIRTQLNLLEQNNETVKSYFNTLVPDSVACLLERTCESGM